MIFLLILLSSFILAEELQTRAFTEAENLVLADCGIGTIPGQPTWSTSREVLYYPSDVWTIDGTPNRPTMMANVPWDGSYPWRSNGVDVKLPNGDKFSIKISPGIPDLGWAGWATHTYDSTTLICWAFHQERLYKLDDGKWCSAAYVCNHRNNPTGRPPTKTEFYVQPKTRSIYEANHRDILNKVDGAIDAAHPNFCKSSDISIGRGCNIKFECSGAGKASVQEMANYLKNTVANSKDFASYRSETTQVCVKWDSRPGFEGQCVQYKDKVDRYVTLPESVEMVINNVPPATSPTGPSQQARMKYTITCGGSSEWNCKMCNVVAAGLGAINGFAGAAAGASCAVAC